MPRLAIFRLPTKLRRQLRRNRMATLLVLLALLSLFLLIPLLSVYCVYKPPRYLLGYLRSKYPDVLFEEPSITTKVMALSFDDAPSSHTDEILSILAEYNARATFFVIGSQAESPTGEETLRKIIRGGHELGNHAMHDEPSSKLSLEELENQVNKVKDKLVAAYTAENKILPNNYFRPGSGFFNLGMRNMLGNRGFRITLGSIYPHDPQMPYPELNAKHIQTSAHPGAIIIAHDRRSWTPPMLRMLLPKLKEEGWQLVTITELVKRVEPLGGR